MEHEYRYLTVQEFIDLGVLQEINRLLLHPRGLALAIDKPANHTIVEATFRVWDDRYDPEGTVYHDHIELLEKAKRFGELLTPHIEARCALFDGEVIQPLGDELV